MTRRFDAAALGIAIAFQVVSFFYWNSDDMVAILCPAVKTAEPYRIGNGFFYPIWTLHLLRIFCHASHWTGVLAGTWSILVVLTCTEYWYVPAWVALISPPFLWGIGFCHPFEALTFLGLTLAVVYWYKNEWLVGIGLALMAFKPQLGFVPGLYIAWQHRREWRIFLPPILLILGTTCLDFVLTDRLWIIPFYRMTQSTVDLPWNSSLWDSFGWLSLLWLPIGIWALLAQKSERKRLFITYILGLLLMPYWAAYSLWPLIAMVGCWKNLPEQVSSLLKMERCKPR